MSDDDKRLEQLLDLLVYAPLGLALESKELLPKLAERGRGQVALMRLAQRVAADSAGRSVAGEQLRNTLLDTLDNLADWFGADACYADSATGKAAAGNDQQATADSADAAASDSHEAVAADKTSGDDDLARTAQTAPQPGAQRSAGDAAAAKDSNAEPFAGYDSMTAKDIIAVLSGLSEPELADVAGYERRNRARSTVLNRVARLLG